MAQLDKLLPRLNDGVIERLRLEPEAAIHSVVGKKSTPLTSQPLSRPQILGLIAELAKPEEAADIATGQFNRLAYRLGAQWYLIEQDAESDNLRVFITKTEPPLATSHPTRPAAAPEPLPADDPAGQSWQRTQPAAESAATTAPTPSAASRATDSDEPDSTPRVHQARASDLSAATHPGRRARDRPFGSFPNEAAARDALERLLRYQVEKGAADLHLRIGEPPILRLGGDLTRMDAHGLLDADTVRGMLLSVMPEKSKKEFADTWDTDFAYEIAGLSRFRVNVLTDRAGPAAVLRTIASKTVTVEDMGVSPEVQKLCHLTKGLVLVTGPTGSGKSTTLCALVDLVNRTRKDHIITIEDPIEFVHKSKKCLITQRQVGVHTASFKTALRAALREDPDVILIGELRDLETIAIALETAETGHLVFGTLHTSTAASTINRIVDQFPADRQDQIKVMLAESLKGVIRQTLCKKIGGGRVPAREILLVTKGISSQIREGKTSQINNSIQTGQKMGMELLNAALLRLVKERQVDPREAYAKSVEKKDMAIKLKELGHDISDMASEE